VRFSSLLAKTRAIDPEETGGCDEVENAPLVFSVVGTVGGARERSALFEVE
jgi:hypothetical protein